MQRPNRIPLFPLDVVLMPGAELPLHIFEPRYKLMIARCLEEKLQFGMILAANQSVAAVGCTAEIVQKLRDYPDGRMDIMTKGREVFHLTELFDEKEYYEGAVDYVQDDVPAHDVEQESTAPPDFREMPRGSFSGDRGWTWPQRKQERSRTAWRHSCRWSWKRGKRSSRCARKHDRREFVLRWMERFLPKLVAVQRTRKLSGGNGHTLN